MCDREVCLICGQRVHADTDPETGEQTLKRHELPRRSSFRGSRLCDGSGLVLPPVLKLPEVAHGRGSESHQRPSAA